MGDNQIANSLPQESGFIHVKKISNIMHSLILRTLKKKRDGFEFQNIPIRKFFIITNKDGISSKENDLGM